MTISVGVDFKEKLVRIEAPVDGGNVSVIVKMRSPIEVDYLIGQLQAAREVTWGTEQTKHPKFHPPSTWSDSRLGKEPVGTCPGCGQKDLSLGKSGGVNGQPEEWICYWCFRDGKPVKPDGWRSKVP